VISTDEAARLRLQDQIEKRGNHWIWCGGKLPSGQGRVYYAGRLQTARQVFYQLYVGQIPEGHWIVQKCRVDSCVSPECLEAVRSIGPFGVKNKVPTGEEVEKIRRAVDAGPEKTYSQIANSFGVSESAVRRIRRGTYRIGRKKPAARERDEKAIGL
jgi:hypothetical protein